MSVINVTPEAHARAKEAAERAGVSLAAWASERLLAPVVIAELTEAEIPWDSPTGERLVFTARDRGETPAATLAAALDALARPAGVLPAPSKERGWCGCDGEEVRGRHHKRTCHNWSEA